MSVEASQPSVYVLPSASHEQAARDLNDAEQSRCQIRQLTLQYPQMTIGDAYEVQEAWRRLKVAKGRTVVGHKVGITSHAMRQALGINDSDLGTLFDDMQYTNRAVVPSVRFIEPKIEVELAFVLERPVGGPGIRCADVLAATEWVIPAIELLDARMHRVDPDTGRRRTVVDTISDNAANAAFLLADQRFRPDGLDLSWVAARCVINGEVVETGTAAGVLNHPANGIAWLANALSYRGVTLPAGQVLLSGSFIRPIPIGPGDKVQADFGPYGTVSFNFE